MKLSYADYSGRYMTGLELEYTKLDSINFSDTDLSLSIFKGVWFVDCDFRGANLSEVELKNCEFFNCNFTATNFSNSNIIATFFNMCCMESCKLVHAQVEDSLFYFTSLKGAGISLSTVMFTRFKDVDFFDSHTLATNFVECDVLEAKNFRLLNVQDPRGFSTAHAVKGPKGWRIRAGCRNFSVLEAKAHWSPIAHEYPEIANSYKRAVQELLDDESQGN